MTEEQAQKIIELLRLLLESTERTTEAIRILQSASQRHMHHGP